MHLSEGELRAYQDQELSDQAIEKVEEHLASCSRCRDKGHTIRALNKRVEERLLSLQDRTSEEFSSAKIAYSRFERRVMGSENPSRHRGESDKNEIASLRFTQSALAMKSGKEKQTMWKKLNSRIPRPVWVAVLIIAILSVSMAFPSVRAIANSFLGLFRVEQIRVIQVDTEKLPGQLESSSQLERIFSENVEVEDRGEPKEVSSAVEASELTGIPVILPTSLGEPEKLLVQPGGSITFQIDLELVRAVLKDIERSDIVLPDSLDGTSVRMDFQGGILTQFGNCIPTEAAPGDPDEAHNPRMTPQNECTTLMQAYSPTISAPPELDIASLGEAYLQILGMTPEEAASFSHNVDWTTTFILPIPRYSAEYQEVEVGGVTGTLITHWDRGEKAFTILWLKNGILYALSGPGNKATALEIAGSLK